MNLRPKQSAFLLAVGHLILRADELGYDLTLGDGYRDPRATFPYSSKSSRHAMRLAIDLNVFRDGVYLSGNNDYPDLCQAWRDLGGISGADFNDANHFEWPL